MKIHSNSQPMTLIKKDGSERSFETKNLDVVMSTKEISGLIADLKTLKKEGRHPEGYHIHMATDDPEMDLRFQVTLCHEKSYCSGPDSADLARGTVIEL